ncbi:MAG: hypothetical protein Ct9H300mP7_1540 [Verrucomicrobiota bacterium]|nr:MAG: hypothetical protein Ct9H300mP7_1540 [Verrucomicrobiota bacterium]
MRNPIKFLHPLHFSLIILCGYGARACSAGPGARSDPKPCGATLGRGTGIVAGVCSRLADYRSVKKILGQHIPSRGFELYRQVMASFSAMEIILSASARCGCLLHSKICAGAKWRSGRWRLAC